MVSYQILNSGNNYIVYNNPAKKIILTSVSYNIIDPPIKSQTMFYIIINGNIIKCMPHLTDTYLNTSLNILLDATQSVIIYTDDGVLNPNTTNIFLFGYSL